jgi:uncharacterized protein (DUF1778 family)
MTEGQEQSPITLIAGVRQRELIDRAAERMGRSSSDFILDAACREAEEILLDDVYFPLDTESFGQFQALLDRPPAPSNALRNLLSTKAPWE